MDLSTIIYTLPSILIGLTINEYSHALMALRLGDTTAKDEGRITLNPIKHIDPVGMLLIIFAGFGWAKPVRFNSENLSNPNRDRALIALAGPLSNLIAGILALFLMKGIVVMKLAVSDWLFQFFIYFASINLGLFIFNMLPFPPLDGSHLVLSRLKLNREMERKIVKYGSFGLLAVILIQNRTDIKILPIGEAINYIFGLFF